VSEIKDVYFANLNLLVPLFFLIEVVRVEVVGLMLRWK
jgi:hypothetical protein